MTDPFFIGHPSLNHRDVDVIAFMVGRTLPCSNDTRRALDWSRLTLDERLELERLLAKAAR